MRPILRWRPERVSGTPSLRDSLPLAADMPNALFHENEKPNFRIGQSTSWHAASRDFKPEPPGVAPFQAADAVYAIPPYFASPFQREVGWSLRIGKALGEGARRLQIRLDPCHDFRPAIAHVVLLRGV